MNNNLVAMPIDSIGQMNMVIEEDLRRNHEQALKDAFEKGRREGRIEGLRESIVQLLELKFSQQLDTQRILGEAETIQSKLDKSVNSTNVELTDDLFFTRKPISPRCRACMHRLVRLLKEELRDEAQVLMRSPIILTNSNFELIPDISVVRYRDDEYVSHHPSANDIFLVVEVSRSTLESDRDTKYQLYARENIAEYWILNLVDDLLEVHQGPYVDGTGVAGYRMKQTFGRDERISPLVFPGCQILVDEMFP